MGVFGEWQPQYAEAGLVTFPVDITRKAPAVGNYLKAGLPASNQWATKFADATALGIACGKRNRVTVLDIDEPCENLLADAQSRFGASPVIARTASGKFHAYYRHNGEKRKIRGVIEGRSVDLLGAGGMAIAPPSSGANGRYEFIQGSLADFGNLPVMHGLSPAPSVVRPGGEVIAQEGNRTNELLKICLREARSARDANALYAYALSLNERGAFVPPLSVGEVLATAAGAWLLQTTGRNMVGAGPKIITDVSEFDRVFFPLDGKPDPVAPDASYLLTALRRVHYDRPTFHCANEFHKRLGWPLRKLQNARRFLENNGCLVMLAPPCKATKTPAIYRFAASR